MTDEKSALIADYEALKEAARAVSTAADNLQALVRGVATNDVSLGDVRAIRAAFLHCDEIGQQLLKLLS